MSFGVGLQPKARRLWKKLLYLKQPYPDNYTNVSFLDQLKTNSSVRKYSYWHLAYDFSLVLFYLHTIFIVILVFGQLYNVPEAPVDVVAISGAVGLVGGVMFHHQFLHNVKLFSVIGFVLLVLSPVLKSLTRSTSSDSIWALSFILCVANAVFHDYSLTTDSYRPIVSTNISLANGIVLASRLVLSQQTFFFLLFTIQMNILVPYFHYLLRRDDSKNHLYLLGVSFVVVAYLTEAGWLLVWWSLAQAAVVLVLPGYFLWLQRYKNELQGPWDPARPIIRAR